MANALSEKTKFSPEEWKRIAGEHEKKFWAMTGVTFGCQATLLALLSRQVARGARFPLIRSTALVMGAIGAALRTNEESAQVVIARERADHPDMSQQEIDARLNAILKRQFWKRV